MGMFFFFLNGDKIRLTYVFTKTSDSGYAVCGAEVPLTKFIVDHHFPPEFGVCQCVAYCLGTASSAQACQRIDWYSHTPFIHLTHL
jgi:hypothetical protein